MSRHATALLVLLAAARALAQESGAGISVDRIKRGLERAADEPALVSAAEHDVAGRPTFRVEVFAPYQLLPPFPQSLDPGWQAIVPGGVHNKEILDMVTPPQVRPYGAFTGGQLAAVTVTSLASAAVADGVVRTWRAMRKAARDGRVAAIRREVEEELAAVRKQAGESRTPPGR